MLQGATLSLSIWHEPEANRWVFLVDDGWPDVPHRSSLLSAEVFALVRRGRCKLFRKGSPLLARIRNLMLIETGITSPPAVSLAPLPSSATSDEWATWDAIRRWLEARALTEPAGEPFAFSAPTMAWALGVDESVLVRGKYRLSRRGFRIRSGTAPGSFGKRAILWHAVSRDEEESGETLTPCSDARAESQA